MRRCLTEKEAAHYIGMSVSFLRRDRMEGVIGNRTPGPKWLKIGRSVRYLKEELDQWLENHCNK
ncbi:MAG: helix-turn-helix transcriptional regulator [Candidatus Berkiella sp.]